MTKKEFLEKWDGSKELLDVWFNNICLMTAHVFLFLIWWLVFVVILSIFSPLSSNARIGSSFFLAGGVELFIVSIHMTIVSIRNGK